MIVLTGGAGFVGSNLLKRLNALGETNILIVDNLTRSDKYRNLVGAKYIDFEDKVDFLERLENHSFFSHVRAIFHQGACTDTLEYDGQYMVRNNFHYSKVLLHYSLQHQIPMIYASSAAVYGHNELATEDPQNETPLNIYGYSKLMFDDYVRHLAKGVESTVVGLRYFNVYGSGESHKGKMSSMVYQLSQQVKSTGVARLFGGIGPYGPGEQRRDFVYVKDLVDMNLFFWNRDPIQGVFNAGTGQARTWNELAQAVIASLGKGTIEYIDFPPALADKYQFATRADLTRTKESGFDHSWTALEEGVKDYIVEMENEEARFSSFQGGKV